MFVRITVYPNGTQGYTNGTTTITAAGETYETAQTALLTKLETHIRGSITAAEVASLKVEKLRELQAALDK